MHFSLQESFRSARATQRMAILSGLLIGVLFYTAQPAINPQLMQKEIDLLSALETADRYDELADVIKSEIEKSFKPYLLETSGRLESELVSRLGLQNKRLALEIELSLAIPWLYSDEFSLTDQLAFWRYFSNYHFEESFTAFYKINEILDGNGAIDKSSEILHRKIKDMDSIALVFNVENQACHASSHLMKTEYGQVSLCLFRQFEPPESPSTSYDVYLEITDDGESEMLEINFDGFSHTDEPEIISSQLNIAKQLGVQSNILTKDEAYLSNFNALYMFANSDKRDLTFSEASEEAARIGDRAIESRIRFPFNIEMDARSAIIAFPLVYLALISFANIHMYMLRSNLARAQSVEDVEFPISSLSNHPLASPLFATVSVISAIFPVFAIYYNPAVSIRNDSVLYACLILYGIALVISIQHIRETMKTKKYSAAVNRRLSESDQRSVVAEGAAGAATSDTEGGLMPP